MTTQWQPSESDLVRFVYDEAEILDSRRHQDWFELFAEDGRYWLPMRRDQTDPVGEQSLVYEDKLLLRIRLERLASPKTYSQQPPTRCQHILQAPRVEEADAGANRYRIRTPFLYIEQRQGDQVMLTGTVSHLLRAESGALRMVEKRVDLLNADGILPPIFLMP
ncbi:MAG: hypothetical protein KIT16_03665 [Rhodospirillaceae bacterium]|nr:hypothetical protein [Rhodospirillaceae bacterium]